MPATQQGATVETPCRVVEAAERGAIAGALRASKGNKPAAVAALGISRAALYQKLGSARLEEPAWSTVGPATEPTA